MDPSTSENPETRRIGHSHAVCMVGRAYACHTLQQAFPVFSLSEVRHADGQNRHPEARSFDK
jgi:hypothetical protein